MSALLPLFRDAVHALLISGAKVDRIVVDAKTADRLWFDMRQLDPRAVSPPMKQPALTEMRIMGVLIERRE